MISERTRIEYALLLSLLVHSLLLTLNFGAWELWLPHFGFLWQDRRIDEPDLRVVMVAPPVIAEPPVAPPAVEPAPEPSVAPPVSHDIAPAPVAPPPAPAAQPPAAPGAATEAAAEAPAQTSLRAMPPMEKIAPAVGTPELLSALPATHEPVFVAPMTPATPPPVVAEPPSIASAEPATPAVADAPEHDGSRQEEQRQAEREAAKAAAEQVEAERVATERAEAARVETARAEAARLEAAKAAAARAEAERVEAERAAAARAEAARVEAERAAAARVEAERAAAARAEAARVEAEKAAAARAEAARVEAEQAETERREAARRAIGRQLDEEAAKRQAASRSLPDSYSGRRYKLLGRTDPNAELIQWVEAWARKIQLNMTFNMVREAAKQPHTDPVVTVAMRSDGSVESVTLELSSGVPAIDNAIRRIVDSQAPYPAFPPELAREWDVIEIRRTWYFDVAGRLY